MKQSDPFSNLLFTSVLKEVFKTLAGSWATKGIVNGDKRLTNLSFTSLSHPTKNFLTQRHRNCIISSKNCTASFEVGLQINRSKTQKMFHSMKCRIEIYLLGPLASFETDKTRIVVSKTRWRATGPWRSTWRMNFLWHLSAKSLIYASYPSEPTVRAPLPGLPEV